MNPPWLPTLISANAEKLIPSHGKFPPIFFQTFNKRGIRSWRASTCPSPSHGKNACEIGGWRKEICLTLLIYNFKALFVFKLYYGRSFIKTEQLLNACRTLRWKDCPNSISHESGKNKWAWPRERDRERDMTGGDVRGVETTEIRPYSTFTKISTDLTLLWRKPVRTELQKSTH